MSINCCLKLVLCVAPDMGPLLTHSPHFLLAVCALTCPVSGLFEWLKTTWTAPPAAPPPPAPPAALSEDARFEMMTADEKFLSEAKQLELSPLDSCHHRVSVCSCGCLLHLYTNLLKTGRNEENTRKLKS